LGTLEQMLELRKQITENSSVAKLPIFTKKTKALKLISGKSNIDCKGAYHASL